MRVVFHLLLIGGAVMSSGFAKQGLFFDPTMPVHGSPVDLGKGGVLARGLLVQAGKGEWVIYDPELLRPAYWFQADPSKDALSLETMAQSSWYEPTKKGGTIWPIPQSQGQGIDLAPPLPGIGREAAQLLTDPRPSFGNDNGRGSLQQSGRRFLGYRVASGAAVLVTENNGVRIEEWYEGDRSSSEARLSRNLVVAPGAVQYFTVAAGTFTLKSTQEANGTGLNILSNHPGLKLELNGGQLVARLEASANERRVSLSYSTGSGRAKPTPSTPVVKAAQWNRSIDTPIASDETKGPGWTIDRLELPAKNPWERRIRPVDVTFLSPERAAVVTFEGDVWVVDVTGKTCKWRRIAAGLAEPMSIAAVQGTLQVFTLNGVIRLRDENHDGETDLYETFCDQMIQTSSLRGYPLDMKVNAAGETFCAIGGIVTGPKGQPLVASAVPHSGAIVKISADGKKLEIIGRGAREPFFDVDPATGRIAMSDQQGQFVPSSGIFPVIPGSYYGYGNKSNDGLTAPVAWIPHEDDTSSASPLWLRKSAFTGWEGGILDVSYGTGRLFLVRPGEGWPTKDGAVIPLQIETGLPLLHVAIHPGDGSLWLAGMRVYDSKVATLEGLGRLRRTNDPLAVPVNARSVKEGVVLNFDAPLDPASIKPENVSAKEWQYRRTPSYGSPRVKRDGKTGIDPVATGGTFLSKDGRSVFIHIPGLQPTMQLQVDTAFALKGAKAFPSTTYFTVTAPAAANWDTLGFAAPKLDGSIAAVREKGASGPSTAEAGKEIVTRYGCIACHSVDGATIGHSGPTWKGMAGSQRTFKDGSSAKADDAYLLESILDPGKRLVKGYELGMGSYSGVLSENEIQSVILYIKSLK